MRHQDLREAARATRSRSAGSIRCITGDTGENDKAPFKPIARPQILEPVYHFAIGVKDKKDEVKMSAALAKMLEEDPSLVSDA